MCVFDKMMIHVNYKRGCRFDSQLPSSVPGVQVWNEHFLNTLNSEDWQKVLYTRYAPPLVHTFSPSFWQFVNVTAVKIFSFCCEPFIGPFFHIFVRTKALLGKCVTHRRKQVVIGRSQIWWVSRRGTASKLSASYVLEPVLPYVMEHCHEEK